MRDDAEDGAHRVALLEDVGAEARHARDAVGEVELELGLEAAALLLGEQAEDHLHACRAGDSGFMFSTGTSSPRWRMPGALPTVMCRSEPPRSSISPQQVVDVRDVRCPEGHSASDSSMTSGRACG